MLGLQAYGEESLTRERRPLVLRSSSLMEDDPHHSFAGIYLSTFGENARAYRYLSYNPQQGDRLNRKPIEAHLAEDSNGDVFHLYFAEGLDVYVDGQGRREIIAIGA